MARALNPAALREIRGLVGISQRELARRVGSHQGTITNLERGVHPASPQMMRSLANALGVSLDAITTPEPQAVTA